MEPEAFVLPSGVTIHVPKAVATFKLWTGKVPFDTYGGKAVLEYRKDLECRKEPMFAELLILRMFEAVGWKGVWEDSYRRKSWIRTNKPGQIPAEVAGEMAKIEAAAGCRGGCFDVVLWRGTERLFVESKRSGRDRIRKSQLLWLDGAIRTGLSANKFLIVEWNAN